MIPWVPFSLLHQHLRPLPTRWPLARGGDHQKASPDVARGTLAEGCAIAPGWEPLLRRKASRGTPTLTSLLPVSVREIWQSRELRRRGPVLHRVWQRDGARPAGSQVSVYHVLRDRGAPEVSVLLQPSSSALPRPKPKLLFIKKKKKSLPHSHDLCKASSERSS